MFWNLVQRTLLRHKQKIGDQYSLMVNDISSFRKTDTSLSPLKTFMSQKKYEMKINSLSSTK